MDELAAAAKQDPVPIRRACSTKKPLAKAVLDLAAEKAGWGQLCPQGSPWRLLQFAFASYMAQVADVEWSKDGAVRVRRVVCAVDCGTPVNPDTIRAQIQSAIMFGITAALPRRDHAEERPVEADQLRQAIRCCASTRRPAVEVHIVQSAEPPGGMGEAGTLGDRPRGRQRDLCRHRQAPAQLPINPAALKQPA